MYLKMGSKKVTVSPADVIGVGGEAEVYRLGDRALKVYTTTDGSALAQKQAKLADFPVSLPSEVHAPLDLLTDLKGRFVGFSMALADGAETAARLAQRPFREGTISNTRVMGLFRRLHGALLRVHAQGIVLGDFNDGNVIFTKSVSDELDPHLIDVDSWQFGSHRCLVAHDRFLDPRLYGADLSQSSFDTSADWYSFCVMLFGSLLYVHPYGGTHPTIHTMARRAEASHSALRPDVTLPKVAAAPETLPDELLRWFEAVFDRGARDVFPERLLGLRFTQCACGVDHARAVCPSCATRAARPDPVRQRGQCRESIVAVTRGRFVYVALSAGRLVYLSEEDGVLVREDGTRVTQRPAPPALRVQLAGRSTYLGMGNVVVEVEREQPVGRYSTARFGHVPAFAASSLGLFRVQDGYLVRGDGIRMGTVLDGQTYIHVGESVGYGFYRVGGVTVHFVFRPERPGFVHPALPPVVGRILDLGVVSDDRYALVTYHTELEGRVEGHAHLVDVTGCVKASLRGDPKDSCVIATVGGQAMVGGRFATATDQGVVLVSVENGHFTEKLFVDSEPFVRAGDALLPGPNGSLYVVRPREIRKLSLG